MSGCKGEGLGMTIWFWGGGGLALFGNRYSDLEMLKIDNLSSSGKEMNKLALSLLELGENTH